MATYNVTVTDSLRVKALQAATDRVNSDAAAAALAAGIVAPAPLTPDEFLGTALPALLDGYVDTYLQKMITSFAFARRFTATETAAIYASTDPNVVGYLYTLSQYPTVTLTDALAVQGVGYLEQVGLIAAGRGAQILTI